MVGRLKGEPLMARIGNGLTLDGSNRKRPVIGEQLRPIVTRLKGAKVVNVVER